MKVQNCNDSSYIMLKLVQVSIYGHSLGSVLSYDILCHQENLSSPFPMDLMYKEHVKGEDFSFDSNNQSSMCNSSRKLEDKNSAINDTKDKVGPIDDKNDSASPALLIHEGDVSDIVSDLENKKSFVISDEDLIAQADDEKRSTPPTLLVHENVLNGNTEDASTNLDTVASDYNVLTEGPISSKQSTGKEGVHESVYNSRDLILDNRDILDETTRLSSGVCSNASERMFEDEGNKDQKIKSLRKEVRKCKYII